ncbi:MAG: hypothetical protein AAGA91_12365 [Pseudomonadota bacterium]
MDQGGDTLHHRQAATKRVIRAEQENEEQFILLNSSTDKLRYY